MANYLFERLDVYRVAREALRVVIAYRSRLKGLPGEVASQLERATVSMVANIAEATGRNSPADRRNRFAIARAEANEAGAMVEIVVLYGVFSDEDYAKLRSSFQRVTYMLTALMRR
ncbi:MAG TPA: four helix bundle protein [Polyangia bacterium]|nr:four helix bundle protein [Polyangia bacterium]